jgi:hypothetical protein
MLHLVIVSPAQVLSSPAFSLCPPGVRGKG